MRQKKFFRKADLVGRVLLLGDPHKVEISGYVTLRTYTDVSEDTVAFIIMVTQSKLLCDSGNRLV
jgi:hypothetical protein